MSLCSVLFFACSRLLLVLWLSFLTVEARRMLFKIANGQLLAYGFRSGVFGCSRTGNTDEVRARNHQQRLGTTT
jgi:hypothetical protein